MTGNNHPNRSKATAAAVECIKLREINRDLLAALKAIHERAKGPLPWTPAETRRERAEIENLARVALAKARGEIDATP